MDCSGRSNNDVERERDLVEDLSHEEHSDEEMRDCDSIEGQHSISAAALAARTANGRLNNNNNNNNNSGCGLTVGDLAYSGNNNGGGLIGNSRSPDTPTDIPMNHHHRFSTSHPLNALGNFMGIGGLHGLPNMSHDDVLEKLKMQVREMKAGLMEQDYAAAHAAAFGGPMNTAFSLPPTSMSSFGHPPQSMSTAQTHNSLSNGASNMSANTQCSLTTPVSLANGNSGSSSTANNNAPFSFTSPTAPNNSKDVNLASNSSTSSEASNSSQQNNGWSFEEQYKQVRQLYEINDDPKRKEFLDDLFAFMQKRGTPINRLPIMAKSVLDLFELYNLVIARGGLVDVINKKLWQEIIKGLHLPSSITSAAFTLRTQYMKFLYPYECEKKNLSSPSELQAAIDGNRREGRRSSYGQYDTMHSPLQMQMSRQNMSGGMQQMSPLALVTHAAAANNQQAAAAAAAAAHHRLMAPNFGQVPNLMTAELEQRMMEYLKLIQVKKEQQNAAVAAAAAAAGGAAAAAGNNGLSLSQHGLQHQAQHQQQRQRSQSPEMTQRDALSALEMSRVALWQMYHNNTSPPASVGASPQSAAAVAAAAVALANNHSGESQREALNLSDSPPNVANIKRERDRDGSPEPCDEFNHQPPAAKRAPVMPAFPGGFWPPGMAAAAAAANFHQSVNNNNNHDSDMDGDGEHDEGDEEGEHNTTVNSNNSMEGNNERQLNGHHHDLHHHLHNNHHLMHAHHNHALHHHNNHISLHHSDNKSDDSAIEHSPTTSGGSASGTTAAGCAAGLNTNAMDDDGNISPVSTKKIHLSKQGKSTERHKSSMPTGSDKNVFDAINLFSSLQFNVKHHGVTVNGDPQLHVNLQLNGIKYSGILLGKSPIEQSNSSTILAKAMSNVADNNINLSGDNTKKPLNEDVESMKVVEEIAATARTEVAPVMIETNNELATVNVNKNTTTGIINTINEHAEVMETEVERVTLNVEPTITTTTTNTNTTTTTTMQTEVEEDENEEEDEDDEDEEIQSHENSSRCSSPPRPVMI